MSYIFPILGCLALGVVGAGCGDKTKIATSSANLSVTANVAPNLSVGGAQGQPNLLTNPDDVSMLSYNPTSYVMGLDFVHLCKDHLVAHGEGYSCDSGGIGLHATEQEVELIGRDPSTPITSFVNSDTGSDQFGDYHGLVLHTGDLQMAGSLSMDGATYSYEKTRYENPLGWPTVDFASPVRIDDKNSGNVQIFVESEGLAYATHYQNQNSDLYQTANLGNGVSNSSSEPVIIAYAGNGSPTSEVYDLTFDTEKFGTKSKLKLKVTVIKNPDGSLYSAGWRTLYLEGFVRGELYFEPLQLNQGSIVHGENSYALTSIPAMAHNSCSLTIDAFRLENHSGTAKISARNYDGVYTTDTYSYTASKR